MDRLATGCSARTAGVTASARRTTAVSQDQPHGRGRVDCEANPALDPSNGSAGRMAAEPWIDVHRILCRSCSTDAAAADAPCAR
jgi:hypothetical protein